VRIWRDLSGNPLTPEQRTKQRARQLAGHYRRKGILKAEPCETCASTDVEMHHDDYSQPLNVRWFCFEHHRELHRLREVMAQVAAAEQPQEAA
jgi:hypothetical protein